MKGYKVQTGKNRDIPIFEIFNNIDKFTEKRIYFKNGPYKFENIETFDRTFKHKWFKNKKSALNYIKEYLLIKKNYHKNRIKEIKDYIKNFNTKYK